MNDPILPLFSDWNDALSAVIHALGGFKKVAVVLRPELAEKPESAGQWLRDCLNSEKRERMNPDQVFMLLRLARQKDYHAAKFWMDAELGYEQGRPLSPKEEAANLVHRCHELAHDLRSSIDRLERISKPVLSAVDSAA